MVIAEPTALVATPRNLDKTWSRALRGDRGGVFDAMSLVGAILTIVTVALARSELVPGFPVALCYISGALWVLGFGLGTRAQMRSGKTRRLALTQGPLVALGVVEAEDVLAQAQGVRRPVGRALVLMRVSENEEGAAVEESAGSEDESLRDAKRVSEVALALAPLLDTKASQDAALAALKKDRFNFTRVPVTDPKGGAEQWVLTRIILEGERLGPDAGPLSPGSVVWGIYHEPSDILEQALL